MAEVNLRELLYPKRYIKFEPSGDVLFLDKDSLGDEVWVGLPEDAAKEAQKMRQKYAKTFEDNRRLTDLDRTYEYWERRAKKTIEKYGDAPLKIKMAFIEGLKAADVPEEKWEALWLQSDAYKDDLSVKSSAEEAVYTALPQELISELLMDHYNTVNDLTDVWDDDQTTQRVGKWSAKLGAAVVCYVQDVLFRNKTSDLRLSSKEMEL